MNVADDMGPEGGGDNLVAAEYVLGVLPAQERQIAAQRIEAEQAFARLVDRWEVYFSPLAAGYAAGDVPAGVKAAVDRRLFSSGTTPATRPATRSASLLSSLALWRSLAVAALAALALYIALPVLNPSVEVPPERLVASLAADGSDVRYLAVYDASTHDIGLSHVSGPLAPGRDFELWVIDDRQVATSLGVIPPGSRAMLPVADDLAAKIVSGAVFAITLEPPGGSPTGQATGPIVAAGDLKAI
ncbi:anti-sigma factor [Mesorhizobium sp. KR9-304]|uniref:anti-sigma factor n=1 Tax=Mesorhizobium sp. KR9-304 TaxID=3156614 RepID=UPI0032B3DDDD